MKKETSSSKTETLNAQTYQKALESQAFVLFTQPKINLETMTVIGGEGLLRWKVSENQILLPDLILPFIEKNNEYVSLTLFLIKAALKKLRAWHEEGIDLHFSVNIPAICMTNPDFYKQLLPILRENHHPLNSIIFEITEQTALTNLTPIIKELKELREIGIRLSIDDFGTGYSSLIRLMELPFSELKIDQSMVKGIPDNEKAKLILEVIFDLAKKMNLKICAEGIENKVQEDYLRSLGCDYGQGFLYAPALEDTDFLNFIHKFKGNK